MPRLTTTHWKVLVCIFKKAGFIYSRTTGDHMAYIKKGCIRPIIPKYKEIDVLIIKNNMRSANMSREKYFEYLKYCQ